MKLFFLVLSLLVVEQRCQVSQQQFDSVKSTLAALSRQVMLQQFFTETRVRTEGQSGLKANRQRTNGLKNYYINSHTGFSAAAIHEHANNDRTVGMGELTAVLNGIEFKTRHNDYRLYMPHRTSKNLNAYEKVPFPEVPPEVLAKPTVDEQIAEMREYFKAWRDQDPSHRDYRPYFKAALCYLEGAWTASANNIDEPFASDRHFVDAKSWMELHEKSRYIAYSGTKSRQENLSFLPTKIMGLINDTIPNFAQWNYRIMCHPLKRDLPTKRLRVVEDLAVRMRNFKDILRHEKSRSARFQLNTRDQDNFREGPEGWKTLLDELMEEIPGKDNYQVDLEDDGLDGKAMQLDGSKLNAGYYHRWFTIGADAMGSVKQHRGYNDDYMFAALNTQDKIAGIEFNKCERRSGNCKMFKQKWSYAIPLEIIYMTPLYKWNPYGLKHYGDQTTQNVRIINEGGSRNGDCKGGEAKAYKGINSRHHYMTPAAFYSGASVESSAADTARGVTCVLDQEGNVQQVRAAGTHIFLPQIKDVGVLRTRYPIFPVHGEGSSVWKELNALREVTMNEEKWQQMYWKNADLNSGNEDTTLLMGESTCACAPRHTHEIKLDAAEVQMLKGGFILTKESSTTNAHFHSVKIRYDHHKKFFEFTNCDGKYNCWDKHVRRFVVAEN